MQLFNLKIYFFLFVVFTVSSQEREQIEIKFAPYMTIEEKNPEATILTRDNSKQVHIKHKGIELWCDKAVYYQDQDFIEAFGKVLVKQCFSASVIFEKTGNPYKTNGSPFLFAFQRAPGSAQPL